MATAYTADGVTVPDPLAKPPSSRPDALSLPPLRPVPTHAATETVVRTTARTTAPLPLNTSSFHAYVTSDAESDEDDDDAPNPEVAANAKRIPVTPVTKAADEPTGDDEEQLFRVPSPSCDADTRTDAAPVPRTPSAPTPASDSAPTTPSSAAPTSSPTDSYYMRVARFLMVVIVLMVVGYVVYWVLANVFGIDLWEKAVAAVWGGGGGAQGAPDAGEVAAQVVPTAAPTAAPTASSWTKLFQSPFGTPPLQPEGDGAEMRTELSDKSAAALLDMMARVK